MKRNSQSGFAAVEAVLIIVIVAVIGFVGWYVWHAQRSTNTTYNAATKSASASPVSKASSSSSLKTNSSDKLDVKEWSVTMTIPASFMAADGSVNYQLSDANTLEFSSNVQQALPSSCDFAGQTSGPWGIIREQAGHLMSRDGSSYSDSDAEANASYVHIGSYFYHRTYPPEGCETSASQVTALDKAYTSLFKSLKAE